MSNKNADISMRWLNETEVAKMTGLSVHTLRAYRLKRRGIPYSKIGRSVRYSSEDVLKFMQQHLVALA